MSNSHPVTSDLPLVSCLSRREIIRQVMETGAVGFDNRQDNRCEASNMRRVREGRYRSLFFARPNSGPETAIICLSSSCVTRAFWQLPDVGTMMGSVLGPFSHDSKDVGDDAEKQQQAELKEKLSQLARDSDGGAKEAWWCKMWSAFAAWWIG